MHCACPPGTQAAVAPNTCTPHTCHTCWALAQGPDSSPAIKTSGRSGHAHASLQPHSAQCSLASC
jgi:hypothetical protein